MASFLAFIYFLWAKFMIDRLKLFTMKLFFPHSSGQSPGIRHSALMKNFIVTVVAESQSWPAEVDAWLFLGLAFQKLTLLRVCQKE